MNVCHSLVVAAVELHPVFVRQFEALCQDPDSLDIAAEVAVVMLIGDKTTLGNRWYPQAVTQIETRLIPTWERNNPHHRARLRRTR